MKDKTVMDTLRVPALHAERSRQDCPDPALVAAFADRALDPESRQSFQLHLADCQRCREEVAFLVHLQEGPVTESVDGEVLARVSGTPHSVPMKPWRWAIAAAAMFVAVLGVMFVQRDSSPPTSPLAQPSGTVRGTQPMVAPPQFLGLPDDARLSSTSLRFRWSPVASSDFYTFRIVTDEGDLLWEGRTEDEYIHVPADQPLAAGMPYYVRVTAHLGSGASINSEHRRFEVR